MDDGKNSRGNVNAWQAYDLRKRRKQSTFVFLFFSKQQFESPDGYDFFFKRVQQETKSARYYMAHYY
jgi:hypothetical protein